MHVFFPFTITYVNYERSFFPLTRTRDRARKSPAARKHLSTRASKATLAFLACFPRSTLLERKETLLAVYNLNSESSVLSLLYDYNIFYTCLKSGDSGFASHLIWNVIHYLWVQICFLFLNVQWIIHSSRSGLAVFHNILISTSGVSAGCYVSFVEFEQFS